MTGMIIPTDWAWMPISQVLKPLVNGKLIQQGWSPQCLKEPSPDESTWGVLKTTAVQPGRFLDEHNKQLPESLTPDPSIEVEAGDLLLTCAGPRARCAIPCLVRQTRSRLMISGKIYRFRANDSVVDPRFLEMYLLSPPAQQALERMKTGISDSGLNLTQARFLRLQVPVPPLAEQRRIVDLLEDHLSRLDNALNSAKTAQRRIRVLTAHAMWSLTHDLGGVDVPLATIAEVRLGRQRSPKNHSGDRMRPYLRAANVNWNRLVLDDVKSMNFTAEESAIYTLRDGDILLTEASGSPAEVGKSAIYRGELVDACFQNTLVRVRRHEGSPEFLHYYLLAEAMRGRFIAEAKGVNIAHLGRQRLAKWPVQLPSDDRQADAVSRVAEVMQSIERLQVSVSNVVRRERTLRGSIFQAAFTGGLTRGPQSQFGQELASV